MEFIDVEVFKDSRTGEVFEIEIWDNVHNECITLSPESARDLLNKLQEILD